MRYIKFILVLTISFIIFVIFYLGLNKELKYYPKHFKKKIDTNIVSKDIFSMQNISLNNLLDKEGYTLLNIWASWCLPCRDEHVLLMELKDIKNLQIIGLNYKDKTINAKSFIKENGNPFDVILIDDDGSNSIILGAYGVPETYLIKNKDNIIVNKYIGILNLKNISEIKKKIK